MTGSEQLLMAACALSFYGAGQVWLVQLSSYPLWIYVGEREFHAYHRAWWRSIWGVILAPSALLGLGSALMVWLRAPGVPSWEVWCGFALQAPSALGRPPSRHGDMVGSVDGAPRGAGRRTSARTLPAHDGLPLAPRRHRHGLCGARALDALTKRMASLKWSRCPHPCAAKPVERRAFFRTPGQNPINLTDFDIVRPCRQTPILTRPSRLRTCQSDASRNDRKECGR